MSPLLLAAALAQAAPFPPVAIDPPSVTITQDNVELDSAGTFTFEPDPTEFDVNPPEGGAGLSFFVRLWFDPSGNPNGCDPPSSPPQKVEQTACAQLIQTARFHPLQGMDLPWRRGFLDIRFSFFNDPAPDAPGRRMFALAHPGYRNMAIIYPADDIAPQDMLGKSDGRLVMQIAAEDYPSMAMRYMLESVSAVRIGIARDGAIRSCRPRQGPGIRTAFLDNYSCRLILQRARFDMAPDTPDYTGLRYLDTTLTWRLPK